MTEKGRKMDRYMLNSDKSSVDKQIMMTTDSTKFANGKEQNDYYMHAYRMVNTIYSV